VKLEEPHSDLAFYRLLHAGEQGLNLRMEDLYDREIELPGMRTLVGSLLSNKPITVLKKAYPVRLIRRLLVIQGIIDKKIEEETDKAKREANG